MHGWDDREYNSATNQEEKPEIKPEVCFADVNDGKIWIIVNLQHLD